MPAIVRIQNAPALSARIEEVRQQLNEAVREGLDKGNCYPVSLKLDRLLEIYIEKEQKNM